MTSGGVEAQGVSVMDAAGRRRAGGGGRALLSPIQMALLVGGIGLVVTLLASWTALDAQPAQRAPASRGADPAGGGRDRFDHSRHQRSPGHCAADRHCHRGRTARSSTGSCPSYTGTWSTLRVGLFVGSQRFHPAAAHVARDRRPNCSPRRAPLVGLHGPLPSEQDLCGHRHSAWWPPKDRVCHRRSGGPDVRRVRRTSHSGQSPGAGGERLRLCGPQLRHLPRTDDAPVRSDHHGPPGRPTPARR